MLSDALHKKMEAKMVLQSGKVSSQVCFVAKLLTLSFNDRLKYIKIISKRAVVKGESIISYNSYESATLEYRRGIKDSVSPEIQTRYSLTHSGNHFYS